MTVAGWPKPVTWTDDYDTACQRANDRNRISSSSVEWAETKPDLILRYGVMSTQDWNHQHPDRPLRIRERWMVFEEIA